MKFELPSFHADGELVTRKAQVWGTKVARVRWGWLEGQYLFAAASAGKVGCGRWALPNALKPPLKGERVLHAFHFTRVSWSVHPDICFSSIM